MQWRLDLAQSIMQFLFGVHIQGQVVNETPPPSQTVCLELFQWIGIAVDPAFVYFPVDHYYV